MRRSMMLLAMSAMMCIQVVANPALRGLVQMPQPDGTLVRISLEGDEFYSFNTTADGYTVMLNDAGAYVYAQREGKKLVPTSVLAHDEGQRTASELALLSTLTKRMIDKEEVDVAHIRRVKRNVDLSNFDFSKFRGLVILIDFADKKFAADDPKAFYTEMFSTQGLTGWHDPYTNKDVTCPGSVRDYFKDQSNGAFNPPFDVYGPYSSTLKANKCYNQHDLIFKTAMRSANAEIDFSKYDNNNDGKVDMVFFLVAGYSAASNGKESGYLWPHASSFARDYINYDGKWLDRYASSTELYGWESSPSSVVVEGIGTVCHEFSHVLGLPDFYDTDYELSGGNSHHPGGWDIMAGGSDYNYGRCPAGYTFYERYALGWADAYTIDGEGSYSLSPVNTAREGYILRTPVKDEFFTIENRQRIGWDSYIPGHGMIVTRVDSTNANVWSLNTVNCNPEHNYFEMLRAGNTSTGDNGSDPFPGSTGNIMLTNQTNPNLTTWAGYANAYNIVGINESADGLITFKVVEDGSLQTLVEDFEGMPVSTGTTDKNVEGAFATWSFSKSGVRAPGSDKANDNNSVMMKLPSLFYSTTPVYYNTYMASMTVFNTTTATAKYSLEYSVENDENGDPIWNTALSSKGNDVAEVAAKTNGMCYWTLNLNNTQPALFRIYERYGHKNNAMYVDDFTLYYTGEEGGPVVFIQGDVNGDGEVNIADINAELDLILNGSTDADTMKRADVNSDSEANIADVNMIIDIILR